MVRGTGNTKSDNIKSTIRNIFSEKTINEDSRYSIPCLRENTVFIKDTVLNIIGDLRKIKTLALN